MPSAKVDAAEAALQRERATLADAARWRRRSLAAAVQDASEVLSEAQAHLDSTERVAAPHLARVPFAEDELSRAELQASRARITERLDRLASKPQRGIERAPRIGL